MADAVVDASAILAILRHELPADTLEPYGPVLAISSVNLGEVVSKLHDNGVPKDTIETAIAAFDLMVFPTTQADAVAAGHMRPETKSLGLSLGDRFCLILGTNLGCPVLTTDRLWGKLDPQFQVILLR